MPDIALWAACDHKCIMCSNPSGYAWTTLDYTFDKLKKRIDAFRAGDTGTFFRFTEANDWVITGGEPTLNPEYLKTVQYIRDSFPDSRIVQLSHGDAFSDESFTKQVLGTFQNYHLCFPLHGFNSKTHDAITRKNDSFQSLIKGIYNVLKYRKQWQSLEIRIILQQMNIDYVDKMLHLLYSYFPTIDLVTIVFLEYEWQAIENREKISISYTKAINSSILAIKKWIELFGERLRLYHFPLCVFKNYIELFPYTWRTLDVNEIEYISKCNTCTVKKYCMWIHESYQSMFWDTEIQPFVASELENWVIVEDNNNFSYHPIEGITKKHSI
jgi:MoaA/NifB/PqqE/SkfB family radical SAM enzyme